MKIKKKIVIITIATFVSLIAVFSVAAIIVVASRDDNPSGVRLYSLDSAPASVEKVPVPNSAEFVESGACCAVQYWSFKSSRSMSSLEQDMAEIAAHYNGAEGLQGGLDVEIDGVEFHYRIRSWKGLGWDEVFGIGKRIDGLFYNYITVEFSLI
ncbi:hypothetical protein FWD20_03375 [Candidatus Saccharibacteria bacterium]|nr:hypothetical protein [Candidatus Saccharibacteria bacterium]